MSIGDTFIPDKRERVIESFNFDNFALNKEETFELDLEVSGEFMDEIVASEIAMAEYKNTVWEAGSSRKTKLIV